jgi:hypothetical protein
MFTHIPQLPNGRGCWSSCPYGMRRPGVLLGGVDRPRREIPGSCRLYHTPLPTPTIRAMNIGKIINSTVFNGPSISLNKLASALFDLFNPYITAHPGGYRFA